MKNNRQKTEGPKDAATSKGPNAKAVEAIASPHDYRKVGLACKGKSDDLAHPARARVLLAKTRAQYGRAQFRAAGGRVWAYKGKRARVVVMLAEQPEGVTQWDCLPWHTRLGGTIHALRCDGLEISTELEGEYRHARYRLHTPGTLIIQRENSGSDDTGSPEDKQ